MKCRSCNFSNTIKFLDLGNSPLANSYLNKDELLRPEPTFPLGLDVCPKCFLVQMEEFEAAKSIFSDYSYFSSYSTTWISHAKEFVNEIIQNFSITKEKFVIEIASNDGYLLQNFLNKNIPCLGIEPASNIAEKANNNSIPTICKFFNKQTALELKNQNISPDFLIAFNVFPHVPNLHDFIDGLKLLLNSNGIIIIQFSAYLLPFIQNIEFDTVYHEHFSFFSLNSLKQLFESHNLKIFDVQEFDIHGGSLRIFITHSENNSFSISSNVKKQLDKEQHFGVTDLELYNNFSNNVSKLKKIVQNFFINAKKENKKIVCYGAAAKGNTLLNYCDIGSDLIDYVADISPHKQNKFLPGTHIPIYPPSKIFETKPDYIVILAWNLKEEITSQLNDIYKWGGKFVVFNPSLKIF